MSDHRAVAAVSATLQNLLTEAIRETVPGATVAVGAPRDYPSHEVAEGRISIFLYKVMPNVSRRNEELPYRRSDGTLVRKPRLALDLFYLLSFYGDASKQIPSLLLGTAMSALHAEPYPNARHVPRADPVEPDEMLGQNGSDLGGSGLLDQLRHLSFSWVPAGQEDVTQVWSTLFQVPYALSVAYLARVVLIEPAVVPQPALPVRQTQIHLEGPPPSLEAVEPPALVAHAGARIELQGSRLDAENVRVMLGEHPAAILRRSPLRLLVELPPEMPAGTHLVRILHGFRRPPADEIHWDRISSPLPLVVRPRVVSASAAALTLEDGAVLRRLRVRFAPPVAGTTNVTVLLNPLDPPPPSAGLAASRSLRGTVSPRHDDLLELEADLEPGRYLLRVEMRGLESPLEIDEDPESPTFRQYRSPILTVE